MDNLSSHKGPAVRAMIAAAGASLFYLPPCSPDFNPIENCAEIAVEHLRDLQFIPLASHLNDDENVMTCAE